MTSKNKLKYLFLLAVLVAAGFALADALGAFNPKPYTEVHHGSVIHYVPDNRDPDVSIERFPTQEPGPDEIITPTGQVVSKSEWKQQQQESSSKKPDSEEAADKNVRTIDIIGTDQMKFVVKEEGKQIGTGGSINVFDGKQYLMLNTIEAAPGEQLRIRLKTLSQLNPGMMSHNWVLLDKDVDPQTFVSAATRENDYIPSGQEEDIIAYTGLAGDGETVEVTFTVPEETGRYEYLCSFMSHFAAGMKGELVVKSKTALNK